MGVIIRDGEIVRDDGSSQSALQPAAPGAQVPAQRPHASRQGVAAGADCKAPPFSRLIQLFFSLYLPVKVLAEVVLVKCVIGVVWKRSALHKAHALQHVLFAAGPPAFDFSAAPVAVARDAPEDSLFGIVPGLRVFGARLSGQHMALLAAALMLLGARGLLLGAVIWVVYTLSQGAFSQREGLLCLEAAKGSRVAPPKKAKQCCLGRVVWRWEPTSRSLYIVFAERARVKETGRHSERVPRSGSHCLELS